MPRSGSCTLAALALLAACGGGEAPAPDRSPATISLTSPAFRDGGAIPERFTCSGEGGSPPLRWARLPSGARALALTVEDPDAPGGTFVHWIVTDIPPRGELAAGAVPEGAHELHEWKPPCPPEGDRPHRYVFTLSALKRPLGEDADADEIARQAIAHGTVTGRFGR